MVANVKISKPSANRWLAALLVGALSAGASVLIYSLAARRTPKQERSMPGLTADRFLPGRDFDLARRSPLQMGADDLDAKSLLARFLDRTKGFGERLRYVQQVARLGTPSAKRALMDIFLSESPANQLAMARILGQIDRRAFQESLLFVLETGNDEEAASVIRALAVLGGEENFARLGELMNDQGWPDHLRGEAAQALLQTGDDRLRRLAIQGMVAIGTGAETKSLAAILHDPSWPQSLRVLAAASLGKIGSPEAGDELIAAFGDFSDEDVQETLLDALGYFPYQQIAGTWKTFLDDPSTPPGLRAAAAEALANSSPDAVPYLESLAASDRDANVREMAAWALSTQPPGGALGPEITGMIRTEPEPDVRRRLYESLLVQTDNPSESLLPIIEQEEDPAARVAAMNAVGDAVGRKQSSPLADTFDSEMVPELQSVALGNSSLNLRMRAVFALRRAGTPAAMSALTTISKTPTPEIATAALNGLQASR